MSKKTCDVCQLWNRETCKCTVKEVLPCMSSCEEEAEKPMTNGDKIRAMSDEELARILWNIHAISAPGYIMQMEPPYSPYAKKPEILDWLKKEAKDE